MSRCNFLTRTIPWLIVLALAVVFGMLIRPDGVTADEKDTGALLSRLKDSKLSLVDGIKQAEQASGPAISAKFELEGGNLMLSVYTAKAGPSKDAEHNTLMELSGDATKTPWQPKSEVFEDKPHIARSAMHLTLMQLTKLKLADVVQKAAAQQKGTVYSVIPAVKGGKPVFDVLVATPDGKSVPLTLDLRTGSKTVTSKKQATKATY